MQVAQREINARLAEQQAQQAQQAERQAEQQARQAQQQQQQKEQAKVETEQPVVSEGFASDSGEQPDVVEHIVATPENKPRNRGPRRKPVKEASNEDTQVTEDQPQPN